jgi:hypothetical protein
MNVILDSSEHAFSFQLVDENMHFGIATFGRFIFAGEVSPQDMQQLLTREWGVGDRLAATLIDRYGGNVWDVYRAVIRLASERQSFRTVDYLGSSQVVKCLKWKGDREGDQERMVDALRRLRRSGGRCDQCQ